MGEKLGPCLRDRAGRSSAGHRAAGGRALLEDLQLHLQTERERDVTTAQVSSKLFFLTTSMMQLGARCRFWESMSPASYI